MQQTSLDAYQSVDKPCIEAAVLTFLSVNGPETCDEVEANLGLLHQTASATITHLRDRGLLYDTGRRLPTRTGRRAIVWGASE